MRFSKVELEKQVKSQKAQQKRNAKRRLTENEERMLLFHRENHQPHFKDSRRETQKRLANLGYLFDIGGSYGITCDGIDYLHAYDIVMRYR